MKSVPFYRRHRRKSIDLRLDSELFFFINFYGNPVTFRPLIFFIKKEPFNNELQGGQLTRHGFGEKNCTYNLFLNKKIMYVIT